MANLLKLFAIFFVFGIQSSIWAIYVVPEENANSQNQLMDDTIEMKPQQTLIGQQQRVKYLINSADINTAATTTTNRNAMLAKTSQRHHTSYDKIDDVVFIAPHGMMHNNIDGSRHRQHRENENANIFENLEQTNEREGALQTHRGGRQRRELSDWLIAPNTRWCGRGNTANGTYNHLGGAAMADKCCRKHDHCKAFIPAMSNRYNLFNYRPYTLSHCSCDRRFRTCLKMANDEDAKTIGQLFFNMVQTQCFVLSKEQVCQQRDDDGTCIKEHTKQKAILRNNRKF